MVGEHGEEDGGAERESDVADLLGATHRPHVAQQCGHVIPRQLVPSGGRAGRCHTGLRADG